MIEYTFKYRREKARSGEIIYRPVIYFELQSSTNEWYLYDAYLDSGADISILTRSDAEFLGYQLEKGKEKYIGGISGEKIRIFLHKIPLKIGEIIIEPEIGFAETEEVPRLLGRKAIFPYFRICFDEDKLMFPLTYKKGI